MNSQFDSKSTNSSQMPIMCDIQRLLSQGEYVLFTSTSIFKSKCVQVKSHSNENIYHAEEKITCNYYNFSPSPQQVPLIHLFSLLLLFVYYTHTDIFSFSDDSLCSHLKGNSSETQQQQCCRLEKDKNLCFHSPLSVLTPSCSSS